MNLDEQQARAFYAARDRRSVEYGADAGALNQPIVVTTDAMSAGTLAGQTAVLALVEMLFRVHRNVRIALPAATTSTGEPLADVACAVAATIDPFQNPMRQPVEREIRLHLTRSGASESSDVVGTWRGGRGEIRLGRAATTCGGSSSPSSESGDEDMLGAATAACLVAAAAFAIVHGRDVTSAAVNLLTRSCGAGVGTDSVTGPIDVGSVDVIGGGAVGHALTYWANAFGAVGTWDVIDGDTAEIHNTNRCLGMTIADAGWVGGVPTGSPHQKADVAARSIGANATTTWFHELPRGRPRPDLTLVLANEYGVRDAVAQRGEPILVHATTSANWTAELHRHIPGRDDCPACRIPVDARLSFHCSEGPADPEDGHSGDAALPFLSATAGLILCAALLDLGNDQNLINGKTNHWLVHLELPPGPLIQTATHRSAGCRHHLAVKARKTIQAAQPRRLDFIDE